MDAQALWLTIRLALATTVVLLLISVPIAGWIASGNGKVRVMAQTVLALPLVLPPTVIGYYLLVGLGPSTWLGQMVTAALGHTLAFSFAGLLVGSIVYSLPFAIQPMVAGFRNVDRKYLEAAAGLGVRPWTVFWKLVLPMSSSSAAAAAVLTFTHTVGEFGIVLMMGGDIPGLTRTLSIVLFDQVQDFNYVAANRTAGALLVFSIACLLLIYGRVSYAGSK